jgi:murein DD-endopeptidase MepM/ murein hydrolase activator NlpD
MDYGRSDLARPGVARWFPERYIHLRSGDHAREFVLTTRTQVLLTLLASLLVGWCVFATGSIAWISLSATSQENTAARMTAYYERMNADRQARLTAAAAALNRATGSIEGLAKDIEKRHEALAWLLQDFKGGKSSGANLKPVDHASLANRSPVEQMAAVREDQDRLLTQAEAAARSRAERLRFAIRMTGLDPAHLGPQGLAAAGGPLIREADSRTLAVELNVDEEYATRVQHAARNVLDFRTLSAEAEHLPMARPVSEAFRSSTYGVRKDPFTGRPAFHAGQDFAGGYGSTVYSTAPGVVAFTGVRTGYGNVVELDHGSGFKTRYAHLASISVRPGQRVGVGFKVGAMGSTGRSTGPHLHYEVWENGRVRDPTRFLKAGDHVQQAD